MGRPYASGAGLPPSRHTWSVRSEYSVVPQSRPSLLRAVRDTERNTEGIGCALSAGVNRRELPSSIQRGKNGKTSPTKCNFLGFYTLGDLEDRVCDLGLECFAFIRWRKPL